MPSKLHEALVEMFRTQPHVILALLRAASIDVPEATTAVTVSEGLSGLVPDYRADCIVEMRDASGRPSHVLVVEAQLTRDEDKLLAFPVYQALARARHRLPCEVVVVTPKASLARWLRRPISLGGRSTFCATVIGPAELRAARPPLEPEVGFLQALAHGEREPELVLAIVGLLEGLPKPRAALYFDLILSALSRATRRNLEALMLESEYEFQSEFMRNLLKRGRVEGLTDAVLKVLDARGLSLTEEQAHRLDSCLDPETLEVWLVRAVVTTDVNDLFGPT